jgi:hypothetical protein
MRFLEAAFYLTQWGFKVFPLSTGAKIPMIPAAAGGRGCLDATDDEDIIGEWDRRYPAANIGLACGIPSGIIVIDIDPRNGGTVSVEKFVARKQLLPSTVEVATANGGRHLYYAWQPELKNSKSALAPGIDIKTTGGYVVAPPSILDGGKKYTWTIRGSICRAAVDNCALTKPGEICRRHHAATCQRHRRPQPYCGAAGAETVTMRWWACSAAGDRLSAIMAALLGAASQPVPGGAEKTSGKGRFLK